MKQKKLFGILAFILLCLPHVLLAQQKGDGFSTMKPGDWFEVLVSDTARKPNSESYRYNIKYLLKEVEPNGDRQVKLSFERIRIIFSTPKSQPLGYDSYYPPFKQGLQQRTVKPVFLAIVDKTGKLKSMKPGNVFAKVTLTEVASRKEYGGTSMEQDPIHEETASAVSQPIFKALADHKSDWFNGGKLFKDTNLSYAVSAASFPIKPNVVIEGSIKNVNQQVRDRLSLYFPLANGEFKIAKDGSFKLTAQVVEGSGAALYYSYSLVDDKKAAAIIAPKGVDVELKMFKLEIPLFLQPGDTLLINADGNDFINTLQFSGNAAKKAVYALKLAKLAQNRKTEEIPYGVKSFSAESFMKAQQLDKTSFDQIALSFQEVLPASVLKYYQLKFTFEQATDRLDFLSKTFFKSTSDSPEAFEHFPDHFFKAIDTLPVLMIDNNTAGWYTSFLNLFTLYQSFKVSKLNGGSDGFFLGDYVLSLNYLKRYPLYSSLARAFDNQLKSNNWKNAQTLKPYYDDFINNCGDTSLTSLIVQKWHTVSNWAPGKLLPLKPLKLADGETLGFTKFKGKVLSITYNFYYPDEMKKLMGRIKKQDAAKVHFIIVQLKDVGFPASTIAEELKKLPQVTYVEVNRNEVEKDPSLLIRIFDIKTFVLDADLQIIEDNINDSPNNLPQDELFNEAIQRALEPKKMNKEQKAELIKTIGWSAGSILFASLIFLWIYKTRVATIRRKEFLQRQMKELEIKAIRSQMNPHFMFNALNSIQSLINSHQYKEANIYLEKFSLLMRSVLNNSEKTFVSLSDELEAVTLYAELEKLRFDFTFKIEVDQNINADLIEIPGMITQPLIENAILHGIARKGSAGLLVVTITKESGCLKIVVVDNGFGWKDHSKEHKGFGLKLVRERLNLLNTEDRKGGLEIISDLAGQGNGVTAVLTIPVD
ncbi:two-component sensor histidine kinase [Pedobacter sp. UYP24]